MVVTKPAHPTMKPAPFIISDGTYGIYGPQRVAKSIVANRSAWTNVDLEALAICLCGPSTPGYFEAYDEIEATARFTDANGDVFFLAWNPVYSDACMIPVGMEWNDEKEWFDYPDGVAI